MAQFDIHRVRGGLALDCQADLLHRLPTRFVVPLEPVHPALIIDEQLNPRFLVDDEAMVMVTQLAGTVRVRDLRAPIGSISDDREQLSVQRALDLLITGV
jgi:toxin CcdB